MRKYEGLISEEREKHLLELDFKHSKIMGIIVTIMKCNINMPQLRDVESESNNERIQAGLPSVRPSTLLRTPSVSVAKSPQLTWKMPKKKGYLSPKY